MKKKICLLIVISFLFVVGCQQQTDEDPLPDKSTNEQLINVEDSGHNQSKNLNNKQIATHLANVAGDVPSVNDAAAIVAGPYAVVGIDVKEDLDRSRVGTIKYSVSEALLEDPYGKTAVVVADADVLERIRSMGEKIQDGYPVQGVVEELSAIVGRYMPNFPTQENQPTDPDQNKQILPDEEEQKLDDIEDEQSTE